MLHSGNNCGGDNMAKKRKISDGATFEDVQALLLKCTRQMRSLMPSGADLSSLDRIEAEQVWQARFGAWIAANPNKRGAIVLGSDQSH
jgi:hypothetical protein